MCKNKKKSKIKPLQIGNLVVPEELEFDAADCQETLQVLGMPHRRGTCDLSSTPLPQSLLTKRKQETLVSTP